jgi:hypothetical protein
VNQASMRELLLVYQEHGGPWTGRRASANSRLRLIFVTDEIPDQLRTIVEFLNEQMTQTEVLAIEVYQRADAFLFGRRWPGQASCNAS